MRVTYPRDKYLNRQRAAFLLAQEAVFPDKRDLKKALKCSSMMYKYYASAQVPLPDMLLFNLAIENPDMAEFSQIYIKHLWGIGKG